jgi:predicted TPR repeat methyltransferase
MFNNIKQGLLEIKSLINNQKYENVLDLGCGTGAFGKTYGKLFKKLIGVDISEKMLKKAEKAKAYDKLINTDILTFLTKNKEKFDLISAIEVIGYMPDIVSLFKEVQLSLNKNGQFLFSVETNSEKPELSLNGRYLYPIEYIEAKLKDTGFIIIEQKQINLRREKQDYAQGYIILAKLA